MKIKFLSCLILFLINLVWALTIGFVEARSKIIQTPEDFAANVFRLNDHSRDYELTFNTAEPFPSLNEIRNHFEPISASVRGSSNKNVLVQRALPRVVPAISVGVQRWAFDTGASIFGSPALGSDGTIYVASLGSGSSDGMLYALYADGSMQWRFPLRGGADASPVVADDGTIYIGTTAGVLHAVRSDGTEKWHFATGASRPVTTVALAQDRTVYFGAAVIGPRGLTWPAFFALNPDRTEKWRVAFIDDDDSPSFTTAPAIAVHGTIYAVDHRWARLFAFTPDGGTEWIASLPFSAGSDSAPAIGSNGTIFYGMDGQMAAVNLDGTIKWANAPPNQRIGNFFSPAIAEDGTVYAVVRDASRLPAHDELRAVDPDTGAIRWSFVTSEGETSFTGGAAPTVGQDGTIYFGSIDHKLYAVNPNGTLKWSFETAGEIRSAPAIGQDGSLYFGSFDDTLYAVPVANTALAPSRWPKPGFDNQNSSRERERPDVVLITPETGGRFTDPDTGFTIDVPPGAVTEPLVLEMLPVPELEVDPVHNIRLSNDLELTVRGAYQLAPAGVNFLKPITISLSLSAKVDDADFQSPLLF